MGNWIRRNWKWAAPLAASVVAAGAWLFFSWFGFHTLFFDETVSEAAPTFTSTSAAVAPNTTTDGTSPQEDAGTEPEASEPTGESTTSTSPQSVPTVLAEGTFLDRSHPTSGRAIVLGGGERQRVLRLEGFRTDNGPDLFVYLSTAEADAPAGEFDEDFVDLGGLKGNVGDQNYEIPVDVQLDRYRSVVIWCRRFSVAFGAADLNS